MTEYECKITNATADSSNNPEETKFFKTDNPTACMVAVAMDIPKDVNNTILRIDVSLNGESLPQYSGYVQKADGIITSKTDEDHKITYGDFHSKSGVEYEDINSRNIEPVFSQKASINTVTQNLAIDPNHPILSLSKGAQQFTIVRDTDHRNSTIPNALAHEIKDAAAAGNKHIILEYGSKSRAELDEAFPELRGVNTQDALKEINGFLAAQIPEQLKIDAYVLQSDLETLDIIERANSTPPQITEEEIMQKSYIFEASRAKTPEETKATGIEFANLITEAMNTHTKIHFAGDYPGENHFFDYQHLLTQKQEYIKENQALDDELMKYDSLESHTKALKDQGLNQEEIDSHLIKVINYADSLNDKFDIKIKKASNLWQDARFSDEALESRAQRFIDLTNGEKAIVLWGAGHFNNSSNPIKDIDEYLDEKLKAQAMKDGTDFTPTKQVALHLSRAEFAEQSKLIGMSSDAPDLRHFIEEGETDISSEFEDKYTITKPQSPQLQNENAAIFQ